MLGTGSLHSANSRESGSLRRDSASFTRDSLPRYGKLSPFLFPPFHKSALSSRHHVPKSILQCEWWLWSFFDVMSFTSISGRRSGACICKVPGEVKQPARERWDAFILSQDWRKKYAVNRVAYRKIHLLALAANFQREITVSGKLLAHQI